MFSFVCRCLPLFAVVCCCLPLFAAVCLCLPLFAFVCHCFLLLAFVCCCLPLFAAVCRCLPLFAVVCLYCICHLTSIAQYFTVCHFLTNILSLPSTPFLYEYLILLRLYILKIFFDPKITLNLFLSYKSAFSLENQRSKFKTLLLSYFIIKTKQEKNGIISVVSKNTISLRMFFWSLAIFLYYSQISVVLSLNMFYLYVLLK